MPHFIVEYSANLEDRVDMKAFCHFLLENSAATGLFPLGGIRVRAYRSEIFAIADQASENAFINIIVRIGAGRKPAAKRQAGEKIFAALCEFLQDELAHPYFALSFDIEEINPEMSWKRNSIHARLQTGK